MHEIFAAPLREGAELRSVARAPAAMSLQDVAPNGDVLADLTTERRYIRRKLSPGPEHDASWLGSASVADLSDDGQLLLMRVFGEAAGAQGAVYLQHGTETPVRIGEGTATDLSNDGKWALAVTASAPERVVMMPTGAGTARELDLLPLDNFEDVNFTPDGRAVVLQGNEGDRPRQLFLYDLETDTLAPITEPGVTYSYLACNPISPDGRHVMTRSESTGAFAILPIAGGDPAFPPFEIGDRRALAWAGDDAIFVVRRDGSVAEVSRVSLSTGASTRWGTLEVPAELAGAEFGGGATITPDGKYYAFGVGTEESSLYLIEGLR